MPVTTRTARITRCSAPVPGETGITRRDSRRRLFLVASDGLTGMVDDRRLQSVASRARRPRAACAPADLRSDGRGGLDNITAIVVQSPARRAARRDTAAGAPMMTRRSRSSQSLTSAKSLRDEVGRDELDAQGPRRKRRSTVALRGSCRGHGRAVDAAGTRDVGIHRQPSAERGVLAEKRPPFPSSCRTHSRDAPRGRSTRRRSMAMGGGEDASHRPTVKLLRELGRLSRPPALAVSRRTSPLRRSTGCRGRHLRLPGSRRATARASPTSRASASSTRRRARGRRRSTRRRPAQVGGRALECALVAVARARAEGAGVCSRRDAGALSVNPARSRASSSRHDRIRDEALVMASAPRTAWCHNMRTLVLGE